MTVYRSDNLRITASVVDDFPWIGTVVTWPSHAERERYLKYRRQGYSRVEALRRVGMVIVSDDQSPETAA